MLAFQEGYTCMSLAAKQGHLEAVQWLVEKADADIALRAGEVRTY